MKGRQRDQSAQSRMSPWNRLTLKFFGPPHVGHYEGPWEKAEADPVCPFCKQRESAHFRDTSADGKRFRRCPSG